MGIDCLVTEAKVTRATFYRTHPSKDHPVRTVIDDQRTWLFGVLRDLSADMGHPDPDHAARVLVLLHVGAFQAPELDNAKAIRETLRRAVDDVFPAQEH